MTPEERDRLRAVEVRQESLEDWLRSIDTKLDELREAAHMGKGAWWLIIRLGAAMAAIAGAGAWVYDHVRHP